ncbi:hypothetical protein FE257_003040 [Aspergillus nanangensis]|uniref:Transcription initiation factor IIA large subunit n=1 Tax=Aspergillus nanangensis TaxID=2582783 RepID=A0AAD4CCE1_ASPNN|nr:hypothetical protein FE257_003040 [Aspergillus nanangensis]
MSNQQVGTVFERVIQEVCDASQVDFEESGVDQQTLLDLKKSWQKKLSSLGVAHFPWDPPPPQPAPPQNQQNQNQILPPTATVPSNAPRPSPPQSQQQTPQQQHHPLPHQQQQQYQQNVPHQQHLPQSMPSTIPPLQAPTAVGAPMGQPPHIKTEPGLNGQSHMPPNNMMPANAPNPQSARDRAANMLHQRYGAAAANSLSQLQAQSQPGMSMPGPPRPQNTLPPMANGQPQIKQEPGYPPVSQPPVNHGQTDGAGDDALSEWKAEVARRREAAERQGGEGDRVLREHLQQRMLQLEGGGLMVPLAEHQNSRPCLTPASSSSTMPTAQFDGPGDDDDDDDEKVEDDEDAINSDLDDPDDLVNDDHDAEDAVGQVMLCTYDKVQRVKNKWKCTLKDGILTTGGKEYVFHKGQGEFEW